MRVLPAGDRALLVETEDHVTAHRVTAALRGTRGLVDVVPGARTVLIVADPDRVDLSRLATELPNWKLPDHVLGGEEALRIPVHYDGADLDEVAELSGLPVAEVIDRHAAADYVVAFMGFSPGFGYITGLDPALHVPRRASPRTEVPAGSVAIAGPYTCVYPRATPGGWRLLGRTDLSLWNADRDPPALLAPGRRVQFVRS